MEFLTLAKMKKLYITAPETKYNRAAVYNLDLLNQLPEYNALNDFIKENIINQIKRDICGVNDFTMIVYNTGASRIYADLDFTITRVETSEKVLYFAYILTGCRVCVYDVRDGWHALPRESYNIGHFDTNINKSILHYSIEGGRKYE